MRRNVLIVPALALVVLALVAAAGCRRVPLEDTKWAQEQGPALTRTDSIDLQGAPELRAEIEMGVGELNVDGEASGTVDTKFRFRPRSWEPEVDYADGELNIRQPRFTGSPFGAKLNTWDVSMPTSMPLDLAVRFGVGEADLDLTKLDVRRLEMEMGTGDVTVDLSGDRTQNLDGTIEAGVGELEVRVPEDVGVIVEGRQDGVGTFEADGFKAQDNAWVNDLYGTSLVTIRLSIQRGVGDVRIVTR